MQITRSLVRLSLNESGIFLFCYALGMLLLGSQLGDRFDAAHVQSLGLILMALVYFVMGASIPLFGLSGLTAEIILCGLWAINGVVQSVGWPTGVKLSFVFSHKSDASIFHHRLVHYCIKQFSLPQHLIVMLFLLY